MKYFKCVRVIIVLLILFILFTGIFAFAGGNTIPPTNTSINSHGVDPNEMKPSECNGISLTNIVQGSGNITGTVGNDLILGSSSNDTISGLAGDDCVIAGDGDDSVDGGDQTDVCLGGSGTDTFSNCESEHP